MRVGLGHDLHRLEVGRALILGGIRIEFERGLMGHSDADVVLHAVADAVLGAAGMGDIGGHFPDTDPANKDLDSRKLLSRVMDLISREDYFVVNCDITIHAQAPKLVPYKEAIRESVARLLLVEPSQVNVKAKTGELVGPVGRGEAIACDAIVLIEHVRL